MININDPLLKVRFDGKAIGTGRIPVSHLLRFLNNLNKALQRTGQVLKGESDSLRRGPLPHNIKEETSLDLVLLTHGSPAAVLGFERAERVRTPQPLPGIDFGLDILEKALTGLSAVQQSDDTVLPAGCDEGVLKAWRDAGTLFSRGVDKIEFTLNHRDTPLSAIYTRQGFTRIQERIKGPQINMRTIEGRLLMADFKEHGTRCRIHPSGGDPVLCFFDNEQQDEVLENIKQYVSIIGEATEDPVSGKITNIKIHEINRLEQSVDETSELLSRGDSVSQDFWKSPTLDELAQAQNVKLMTDVRALFGTWPDEEDDGFEEAIDELRHHNIAGGRVS